MLILYNAAGKTKPVKNKKEFILPWPQDNRLIAAGIITILIEMQGGDFFCQY